MSPSEAAEQAAAMDKLAKVRDIMLYICGLDNVDRGVSCSICYLGRPVAREQLEHALCALIIPMNPQSASIMLGMALQPVGPGVRRKQAPWLEGSGRNHQRPVHLLILFVVPLRPMKRLCRFVRIRALSFFDFSSTLVHSERCAFKSFVMRHSCALYVFSFLHRSAMFFIVVGLLTEAFSGQSIPEQVLTMLETFDIIDLS